MIEGEPPADTISVRDVALVMPMAGRGSRFAGAGEAMPKPLIELNGKPFFWWAAESVRRSVGVREMVCVVLAEHIDAYAIDARIHGSYPDARIISIPDVTSGAAETAALGVAALRTTGPFVVNDSDHAFDAALSAMAEALAKGADGALVCFASTNPAYSYVRTDATGAVIGTAEKLVVGPDAIAGCYGFADASRFLRLYEAYRRTCPYDELFMSGLYDRLLIDGGNVRAFRAAQHISFGTPEEFAKVDLDALRRLHAVS
jgi:NDP-sugar pyrophosphorylase family protein